MNIIIESRNEAGIPETKCVVDVLDLYCKVYDNTNANTGKTPWWYDVQSFEYKELIEVLHEIGDIAEDDNTVFYAEDCGKAERIGFPFASMFVFDTMFGEDTKVTAHRYKDGLLFNYRFWLGDYNEIFCSSEICKWNGEYWERVGSENDKELTFIEFCKIVTEEPSLLIGWE